MAAFLLREIGLPAGALRGDLDGLCVRRLLEMVRGSSLGAIVILAQDRVRDDQGRTIEGADSFYVPNDYVLGLEAAPAPGGRVVPAESRRVAGAKKTGLVSQGVTEKPGEFRIQYNSRITENIGADLYWGRCRNRFSTIKEQHATPLAKIERN
jgi:hypothetical protein